MEQLAAQSSSCCYRVISSGWLAQKRRVFPRYFSTAVGAEAVREQCLKSVDRLGKGRTFPGDR